MGLSEIMLFLAVTMSGIVNAFDDVYLGDYSLLDIFLSIVYLEITFWGIFSLLRTSNDPVDDTPEEREKTWW